MMDSLKAMVRGMFRAKKVRIRTFGLSWLAELYRAQRARVMWHEMATPPSGAWNQWWIRDS
jgi:hypothetical protein